MSDELFKNNFLQEINIGLASLKEEKEAELTIIKNDITKSREEIGKSWAKELLYKEAKVYYSDYQEKYSKAHDEHYKLSQEYTDKENEYKIKVSNLETEIKLITSLIEEYKNREKNS